MVARLIVGLAMLALASFTQAFTPRTGHWNNLSESGSGYNIDIQNGILVITTYSYQPNGASQWYIASGAMTNGQHNLSGTLSKFTGGQCISCSYQGKPVSAGDDGPISINFTSETTATLTLPGGRTTTISPFNFGFGDQPTGLHGEWVYVEAIGSSYFADHYNFTTELGATPSGTGTVWDLTRNAVCEKQVSGILAGSVACIHFSSSSLTTVSDNYLYSFGLDQTFAGVWLSPLTGNQYPMKGHLWVSANGYATAAAASVAIPDATAQNEQKVLAEQQAATSAQASQTSAAMAAFAQDTRPLLIRMAR